MSTTSKKRSKVLHDSLKLHYSTPIEISSTSGTTITSTEDIVYLDCYNNVFPLGHASQQLADIAHSQIMTSMLNTRYLHNIVVEYAEELLKTFPPELQNSKVFFVNSGSEANDLAIRLARAYKPTGKVVALTNAYHGTTTLAHSISDFKKETLSHHTNGETTHTFDSGDLTKINEIEGNVCAIIAETIQGCGGHYIQPLTKLFTKFRKEKGAVCIVDEVQVGFGRTGKMWGFEWEKGCIPDIITLGKPIGNGFPIGAVVCSSKIAKTFKGEYFNTYGGNPLACRIGLHVLREVQTLNLKDRALEIEAFIRDALKDDKHILEIRGIGYFIGIVFCNGVHSQNVNERLKNKHHILAGVYGDVLRLKGPLIISNQELQHLVESIKECIQHFS